MCLDYNITILLSILPKERHSQKAKPVQGANPASS